MLELLSPAGSMEALRAAVQNGANAVYLGIGTFNARQGAKNFTLETLGEALKYCHVRGVQVHLTLNTLVTDREYKKIADLISQTARMGIDAFIVQDLGVAQLCRQIAPGVSIHGSTQMTVHSLPGVQLCAAMGLNRVVLSRELSREEIRYICTHSPIEIEVFVHGALCMCYSGQCYLSAMIGGRSGNRGRCAQPCRQSYGYGHWQEKYPLSLKDNCLVQYLQELQDMGVASLKLEGRMKRPEYAAGTVSAYRRAIDRYLELEEEYGSVEATTRFWVDPEEEKLLSSLYIRSQVQNGYYKKHNGAEMVTIQSPAYTETDDTVLKELAGRFLQDKKRLPVTMEAYLYEGAPAVLNLSCGEIAVTAVGEEVETAQNRPLTEENVTKHLTKLGDTCFVSDSFRLNLSDTAFLPVGRLNELRRQGIQSLEEALLSAGGYGSAERSGEASSKSLMPPRIFSRKYAFSIGLETLAQLDSTVQFLLDHPALDRVALYVNGDLFSENDFLKRIPVETNADIFAALPPVLRENEGAFLQEMLSLKKNDPRITGFLVRTVDELGLLTKELPDCLIHTDANLYCFNTEAARVLRCLADCVCLPYELRSGEQSNLMENYPQTYEKIVYGRIPMMVTANCVVRTADKCCHENGRIISLKDRMGKNFPVVTNCRHCCNTIYNSVPLYLPREHSAKDHSYTRSVRFTTEKEQEVEAVLGGFLLGEEFTLDDYTTGHEKRGVE